MPCRCDDTRDFFDEINENLIKASILIKSAQSFYDKDLWFKEWEKAFSHHLRGCDERK